MNDWLEAAERALAAAEADEAEAVIHAERSGLARFAASQIHQPTLVDNAVVRLRVVRDGHIGAAATNRLSQEALAELARRAAEAADSARPDPGFPGLAPAAPTPEIEGYDEETASLSPEGLASLARGALDESGDLGLYGYATAGTTALAVASTSGQRAEQRATDSTVLVLAADHGASGYAEATGWRVGELDAAAVAREAVAKALRTRDPGELEPAPYRAVLEPYAVAELLDYFAFDAFNGLGLVEERSYAAGKIGERVFDEQVTLVDDPLDPRGLPRALDFEGTPARRVPLVEAGVLRGAVWDRATAARAGRESTGHAGPPEFRMYGAVPSSLSLTPGDASADELAEVVGDGIHVTRLHYLGIVDPREGILTGMTRDGTFRIRDGRRAEPLPNLRFTVAVPELLGEVPALGRELALVNGSDFYGERIARAALVPALATARFNVTGIGGGPGL
ncbi:MAG: TldD/PmbA family protein [Thermoleophilia bacterium]|nr:TldD/PmbA family protein [Thermoleophilia bacterium]